MQRQLIHAPVQDLTGVKGILGRAREFMNPAELLGHAARSAQVSEELAVERQLVDAAGECVGHVQVLRSRSGRDTDCPRCTGSHGAAGGLFGGWFVAHPWPRVRRYWHVDPDLAQELAVGIEHLYPGVASIRHIDISLGVVGDAVRGVELALLAAERTPLLHPVAILIELGNTRVDVAVADEDVSLCIPRDISGLAELPVHGGTRGIDARPRAAFIRGFLLAAKYHHHAAFWIGLDNHVRAFVDGPDIVLRVDANIMRE